MESIIKDVEYKDCYIAFIDILGFKDLVCNRLNCGEIKSIFEFLDNNELENPVIFKDEDLNIPLEKVKKYIMSDSIILYIEKNVKNSLSAIMMQAQFIQYRLILNKDPIIVSGALTSGKMYRNKSYIFGPGIVEAYTIQNKEPHYPRIVIDSELIEAYLSDESSYEKKTIKSLVLKEKRDFTTNNDNNSDVYIIDYLKRISFHRIAGPINDMIEKLRERESSVKEKNEATVIEERKSSVIDILKTIMALLNTYILILYEIENYPSIC